MRSPQKTIGVVLGFVHAKSRNRTASARSVFACSNRLAAPLSSFFESRCAVTTRSSSMALTDGVDVGTDPSLEPVA